MKPKSSQIALLISLLLCVTIACQRESTPEPTSRAAAILEGRQSGTVVVLPSFTPPASEATLPPSTPTPANGYPIVADTVVPPTPSPIVVVVPTAQQDPTPTSIFEVLVIPTPTTSLLISPTPTPVSIAAYPQPVATTPVPLIIETLTPLPTLTALPTATPRPSLTPQPLPTITQASGYPIISIVTSTPLVQVVSTQSAVSLTPTSTPNQTASPTLTTQPTETRLLPSPTPTDPPTNTPEPTQTPIPVLVPTVTETRPPLIGNQLANGSFEAGTFFLNDDDSMAVPDAWTFNFIEGTNPLATDEDNAFKQPNVEVLAFANLNPEKQSLVLDGDHVVKVSKQFQTFSFSLTQPLTLPPGGYILKVNVFPDLILNYSENSMPQDSDSAQMSFLLDSTQLPWQDISVGQPNTIEIRFDMLSETTVTVGAAFRGRWAVTENSWYLDNWSLTAVE